MPIEIVFDGPPSHESGRFVEVEQDGRSIKFGEWREGKDGFWYLVLPDVYNSHDLLAKALKKIAGGFLENGKHLPDPTNALAVAQWGRRNWRESQEIAKEALKATGEEL